MAVFYPNNPLYFNNSYGEKRIFEALHKLNDDYVIFYSTMWQDRDRYGKIRWGESDFTIFNKKKGILVVEVKSGEITFQNSEWIQTRIDTRESHIIGNPLAQADRSKYRFINLIKGILFNGEKCLVEKIVWFPSVTNLKSISNLPLEYSQDIILCEEALENPEYYIEKAFNYYNYRNMYNLSNNSIDLIIKALAPEFKLISHPVNTKNELDYAFLRLTNEQSALLDYLEEQRTATIQGSAGTGKTMLAIEEAKRLAEAGGKVLFLCFNKFLYDYLKNTYIIKDVEFYNIHTFLSQYDNSINTDEDMLKVLKKITLNDFKYNHIIIDEAQDFYEEIIIYFEKLTRKINGKYFIFYDKNQIIYKNKFPKWITNSECKLLLTKNCRNTYQIAITSNNILNLDTNISDNAIKGDMPILKVAENKEDIIKLINNSIHEFKKQGFSNKEIAILTLKKEDKSALNMVYKIEDFYITRKRAETDNEIFFTTSRKFKGLESGAVIIVDLTSKEFTNEINKNNFYVATSRAKQKLTIIVEKDEVINIANVITDIKISNNIGKISTKLKVKPLNKD